MKTAKKRSSKKKASIIMAILTIIALLIAGTYAWYDFSQSAINEFSGTKKQAPSVELVDDFDPDDVVPGANVNKDVYVKNTGNIDVFVRIKLQEYIDLTSNIPGTDWVTHTPGSRLIDCGEEYHDYFEWVLGDSVISMANFMKLSDADKETYIGWVYDTDGYAYWSQPLAAGEQTDLLLDAIKVSFDLEEYDWYYAINVLLEAVDIEDIPKWKEDATNKGKELIDIITRSNAFIFIIDTRLTGDNTITLIINDDAGNDLYIYWGDDTTTSGALTGTISSSDRTHTYSEAGEYTIKITGAMPSGMSFEEEKRLTSVLTPFPESTRTSMNNVFYNCSNLKSIPESLFANNTAVTTFTSTFYECTGLTSIPENLFANNTAVTTFSSTFSGCTSLTSIPLVLFANNTEVTDFVSVFTSCSGVKIIPTGFFDKNTEVTDFQYVFNKCSGLTSIPPGLFDKNTKVENFTGVFIHCTNLTSIPSGLFDNNTEVTDFTVVFNGCTGLTSIPPGLFNNNTKVTNFISAFNGCKVLTSIPSGLFSNNTEVTNFHYTFAQCFALTSIPSGLFSNNTKATNFDATFIQCTSLTSIPSGLFSNNTEATDFYQVFSHCTSLTSIPSGLFSNNTKVINFNYAFSGCTAVTSALPELWLSHPTISHTQTFYNCTKASNYSTAVSKGWA